MDAKKQANADAAEQKERELEGKLVALALRVYRRGDKLRAGALLMLLTGCGGAVVHFDVPPECELPVACVGVDRCELGDGTEWIATDTGHLHKQTIVGNDRLVVSTMCVIDWEGRRIDR
jgi:hypothetical protein